MEKKVVISCESDCEERRKKFSFVDGDELDTTIFLTFFERHENCTVMAEIRDEDRADRSLALSKKRSENKKRDRATRFEFLRWWYGECDFGPADSDVTDRMKKHFMKETGKDIPEGYNLYSDGETSTDPEDSNTKVVNTEELECVGSGIKIKQSYGNVEAGASVVGVSIKSFG